MSTCGRYCNYYVLTLVIFSRRKCITWSLVWTQSVHTNTYHNDLWFWISITINGLQTISCTQFYLRLGTICGMVFRHFLTVLNIGIVSPNWYYHKVPSLTNPLLWNLNPGFIVRIKPGFNSNHLATHPYLDKSKSEIEKEFLFYCHITNKAILFPHLIQNLTKLENPFK